MAYVGERKNVFPLGVDKTKESITEVSCDSAGSVVRYVLTGYRVVDDELFESNTLAMPISLFL